MSTPSPTVFELWQQAWPGTPFEFASYGDRRLFLDHANSLALYVESGGVL